jgi:endo-alpha-1,4-polygalactosaminidase (GH114 family)
MTRDASASNKRALLLTGRGDASATTNVAAPSQLTVVARARTCRGAPRVSATVDGARVLGRTVKSRRWTGLTARQTIPPGSHRIALQLANPKRARGCRRELRIDRVDLVGPHWVPAANTTWQWQLTTPVDQSVDAQMYDIDLFDNPASVVAALHAAGRKVVCYLDVGTYETGRPDSGAFPKSVIGKELPDWPGEHWLDVRRLNALKPIIEHRLDLCQQKGFDGVEPDNVDAYANDSGFKLTAADQLRYNRFVAGAAHDRGLSVGLKNDLDQAAALEPDFDWALNEQCFQYSECDKLQPFVKAGKAVFVTEYELDTAAFCPHAQAHGLMAMRKHHELDAWRETCF